MEYHTALKILAFSEAAMDPEGVVLRHRMARMTEGQRIIRGYYEQLYVNKMDNLDELEKFLEICKLPRLSWKNQGEIQNMNRLITSKKKKKNEPIEKRKISQ